MTKMEKPRATPDDVRPMCSIMVKGTARRPDGSARPIVWSLPEEVPVALQINSQSYAVMMATPADLRDFAVGLLIGEGILTDPAGVRGVLVMPEQNGITIDVAIEDRALHTTRISRRAIEGRTGCGLCGVEELAQALKPLPRLTSPFAPAPAAVLKAAKALHAAQPMNLVNRTVHGAAWVKPAGEIALVREDVGRHNALDKLIGALTSSGAELANGFVLMTSRCSFELVQKCAFAGIGALVTVSAPTALARDLAITSGMYLAALGGSEVVVFNE